MAAVFLVDRAIIAYNPPPASGDGENPSPLLKAFEKGSDILGISILLCGVTVLARIPRLINDQHFWQWNGRALIIFALCGFLYALCVSPETQRNVGALPAGLMPYIGMKGYTDPGSRFSMLTLATVLVGMVIAIGSAAASRVWPDWGMKPLLIWGGATILATIFLLLQHDSPNSIWPVAVAGAILLYAWRLAALLFDLVFVWHRYIRHEVIVDHWKALVWFDSGAKLQPVAPSP
jgi:hypothetical protein